MFSNVLKKVGVACLLMAIGAVMFSVSGLPAVGSPKEREIAVVEEIKVKTAATRFRIAMIKYLRKVRAEKESGNSGCYPLSNDVVQQNVEILKYTAANIQLMVHWDRCSPTLKADGSPFDCCDVHEFVSGLQFDDAYGINVTTPNFCDAANPGTWERCSTP